jgi:hypothetical protein
MTATVHQLKPQRKKRAKVREKYNRFPVPVPPIRRRVVEEIKALSEETKARLIAAAVVRTNNWSN